MAHTLKFYKLHDFRRCNTEMNWLCADGLVYIIKLRCVAHFYWSLRGGGHFILNFYNMNEYFDLSEITCTPRRGVQLYSGQYNLRFYAVWCTVLRLPMNAF